MTARTFTLSPVFPEGLVTDVDMNLLKPTQASALENAIWHPNGHLQKRGGFFYLSGANPLSGNTDKITSCVLWSDQAGQLQLVMGDANGRVASKVFGINFVSPDTTSASSAVTLASGIPVWPVAVYQNEVIVVAPTSMAPTFRWAGAVTLGSSGPGTVSVTNGSDLIEGSGTNFITQLAEAGQYIAIVDDSGAVWYYLVDYVESDTLLRVTSPVEMATDTGLSWSNSPYGRFNIQMLVTDRGTAENSTTTITGKATTWDTGTSDVLVNDFIGQTADGGRFNISATTDDNTLTVSTAPSWGADSPYQITRKMFGNIVCEHQNRLWFSGFANYPNRVALLPPGANPSIAFNGIDSSTTSPLTAGQAEFFDVPSPSELGSIRAMLSVREPGGLAVFRDRDFYMVYGEWPSIQIQKISDEVGCIGWRAACEIPGGVAWIGTEGVYVHRPGGGVQNLCDGKIRRQWTTASRIVGINSPSSLAAPDATAIAYVDEHIIVSIAGSATPTNSNDVYMFAYSLRNEAWVKWTGIAPRSFSPVRNPTQFGTEAIAADQVTNRFLSLSSALGSASTGHASAVNGAFLARSGYFLVGGVDQTGRIIDGKIVCSTSGTSLNMTVKVGYALDTATTITSNFTSRKVRFRPSSTQMGVSNFALNQQAFEIAEVSGTFNLLEVESISFTVRQKRQRV